MMRAIIGMTGVSGKLQLPCFASEQIEENPMLVTFTTKAYADITMFGSVAIPLLKMMWHSGTVPSALRAEDVPAALSRLKAAIKANNVVAPVAGTDDDEAQVSMSSRALPLIELLAAAARENANVMWR